MSLKTVISHGDAFRSNWSRRVLFYFDLRPSAHLEPPLSGRSGFGGVLMPVGLWRPWLIDRRHGLCLISPPRLFVSAHTASSRVAVANGSKADERRLTQEKLLLSRDWHELVSWSIRLSRYGSFSALVKSHFGGLRRTPTATMAPFLSLMTQVSRRPLISSCNFPASITGHNGFGDQLPSKEIDSPAAVQRHLLTPSPYAINRFRWVR